MTFIGNVLTIDKRSCSNSLYVQHPFDAEGPPFELHQFHRFGADSAPAFGVVGFEVQDKPYAPPEVTSTAPKDVNFLIYRDSANERLTLHMINYRYKINTDRIRPVKKSFFVTMTLPEDFSIKGKKATMHSPDLNQSMNLKIQSVDAGTIKIAIPQLEYYNLLVIE